LISALGVAAIVAASLFTGGVVIHPQEPVVGNMLIGAGVGTLIGGGVGTIPGAVAGGVTTGAIVGGTVGTITGPFVLPSAPKKRIR